MQEMLRFLRHQMLPTPRTRTVALYVHPTSAEAPPLQCNHPAHLMPRLRTIRKGPQLHWQQASLASRRSLNQAHGVRKRLHLAPTCLEGLKQ